MSNLQADISMRTAMQASQTYRYPGNGMQKHRLGVRNAFPVLQRSQTASGASTARPALNKIPASQLRARRASLVSLVMPMQHAWQI